MQTRPELAGNRLGRLSRDELEGGVLMSRSPATATPPMLESLGGSFPGNQANRLLVSPMRARAAAVPAR